MCLSVRQAALFFSFLTCKTVGDHCGYPLPFNPLQMFSGNTTDCHDIDHQVCDDARLYTTLLPALEMAHLSSCGTYATRTCSPFTANIYFPAIPALSREFYKSNRIMYIVTVKLMNSLSLTQDKVRIT